MTDTTRLALALNELAAALLELTSGGAGEPSSTPAPAAPSGPTAFANAAPRETAPGQCPVHEIPWTYKPAGVSKAGKPYEGFWKCDGRDAEGNFCKEKPPR